MKIEWTEKEKREMSKNSRNEIEITVNKIVQVYLSGAIDGLKSMVKP